MQCSILEIKCVQEWRVQQEKQQLRQPQPQSQSQQQPNQRQKHQQREQQEQQQQQRHEGATGIRFTAMAMLAMLAMATITMLCQMQLANAADLVINIPEISANENAFYRIDYTPPVGYPEPNTTISAQEIGKELQFSRALAGTKYDFLLFYTNSTHRDLLTWTVSIITAPDPPENLSVQVRSSKNALITWTPPKLGSYSGFHIDVFGLTEPAGSNFSRTYIVNNTFQHAVKELTSGASYQLQVYTIYDGKESVAYASRNFTTKPNTPGKFIVWFRNETTLLVLWQPPFPAGIYTHYKVSIEPPDAQQSVLYVEREGEPPGPAQAAFKGLVPGRAYNISVQTMSEDETSVPTTARYLTVPVRPMNVTFDPEYITTNSFRVRWIVPGTFSEYDNFQVSLASSRRHFYVPRTNETTSFYDYHEYLEPGKTYSVVVKTISVNVNSWPATGEVTLRPMPVRQLTAYHDDSTNVIHAGWEPDEMSTQNAYRVVYFDTEAQHASADNHTIVTKLTEIDLDKLKPGRRYRIVIQALSNNMTSNSSHVLVDTRPAAPVVVKIKSIPMGLNISWQSDSDSKQDKYEVLYSRNGTSEVRTVVTNQTQLVIKNLQPGAGYEIKVYANSHNLRSELHSYFQAVFPNSPRNLTIETLDSSSIQLRWLPPELGEFSEYSVRFRTESDQWQRLPNVHDNKVTIKDMRRGERYTVQVNTVSFGVESIAPLEINTTMLPQPVTNVVSLADAHNLTLEWPAHDGRVDYYAIKYWATDMPNYEAHKNVTDQSIVSAPLVHVPIVDLMPGTEYNFDIQAISYGLNSAITHLPSRTMPLIQSDVFVANGAGDDEPHSLILTYTPTPAASTKFDAYRFSLGEVDIKDKEKSANDTDRKVVFSNLVPGRMYNITVWTLSGGVASVPIQRQDRLYPQPVRELQVIAVSERQVGLHWQLPEGEYTDFEVQYFSEIDTQLLQNVTLSNEITLTDLLPHHNYTFTVVVRSGTESSVLRRSAPHSVNVTTKEATPGRVEYFQPIDVQPSEITFEWFMDKREMNGILRHFSINFVNERNANANDNKEHIVIEPDMQFYTIHGLTPGDTYVFTIQAVNGLGNGAEREHRQTMPILAPPCNDPDVAPNEVSHSARTITLRFRKNYFSDVNGAVRKYSIIVAEDVRKNASGLEIPSWQDVQSYNVWLPYQAAEAYYPFVNVTVEDFVIGSEQCNAASAGFCNGPLKSGTTYRVKVRAFTDDDKFTDTAYSAPIHTDNDDTSVYMTIAIFIIMCLVAMSSAYCYYKRKVKSKSEPRLRTSFPMPEPRQTSRPVHVKNFPEYYRHMTEDSDYRFSEQYEDLKHVGRDQLCTFADLPCNRPKNRFTNILPYDHSRYKLQPVDDDEGSDYINANYVPGYNSPREFIVTQGPLPSTREEFWRMCWESNSPAIIMLTRCIEKGRDKCDQYWPTDRMSIFYGDIKVQLINDVHFTDWVISDFMVSRGGEQRVIRHFHFTTWPDFGVPEPPETLVSFVRTVRNSIGIETRPIVVHCSAGVGRSGTFIALDHIMHQIQSSEYVDIFGVVYNMRKERIQMVQTEQQYICIHECLLSLLHNNKQSLTAAPPEVQERPAAAPEESTSLKQQEEELLSKFYAKSEKIAKDTKLLYTPLPEYTKIDILDEEDGNSIDTASEEKYAKHQHIKDHDHYHHHDDDDFGLCHNDDDDDDDDDDMDSNDDGENTTTSVGVTELETEADVLEEGSMKKVNKDDTDIDDEDEDDDDDDDDDGIGDDGVGIDESPLLVDEGIAETNM